MILLWLNAKEYNQSKLKIVSIILLKTKSAEAKRDINMNKNMKEIKTPLIIWVLFVTFILLKQKLIIYDSQNNAHMSTQKKVFINHGK